MVYFEVIWCIISPFGVLYDHLVYYMDIWYILWSFGIYFNILVCYMKKNLYLFSKCSTCVSVDGRLRLQNDNYGRNLFRVPIPH
jgi:hypothetical protein